MLFQCSNFKHSKNYNCFKSNNELLCPVMSVLVYTIINLSIYLAVCLTSAAELQPPLSIIDIKLDLVRYIWKAMYNTTSRKHTYISLTPLNPTFI